MGGFNVEGPDCGFPFRGRGCASCLAEMVVVVFFWVCGWGRGGHAFEEDGLAEGRGAV